MSATKPGWRPSSLATSWARGARALARGAPLLLAALAAAALGCRGVPSDAALRRAAERAEELGPGPQKAALELAHRGPPVAPGESGPARFVGPLREAFSTERAFATVVFADGSYRAPANEGYDATLDHVAALLREAGFGSEPGFELQIVETTPKLPAWTPRRGELVLHARGAEPRVLHAFSQPQEIDRVMLPQNAPSAQVEGDVALELGELVPGGILVTRSPLRSDLLNRAQFQGAAAVVSASLESYNADSSGAERQLDAIQYRPLHFAPKLPVAQISPRSYAAIVAALERAGPAGARPEGAVRLALSCEVTLAARPLRTLIATVVGRARPDEAVVVASHVQEPGACDNGSGLAGLAESAVGLAGLVRSSRLPRPARSVAFVWGDEMEQTRQWFEHSGRTAIAGISSDMTGQSRAKTGAIALLERMPDPGAVRPLAPDEHTPWGESPVEPGSLVPNGLALIARCALADVALAEGGWETREHPWEGGSDHDVFIQEHGVPAVLFWHFTDFAYHTSLDRLAHVDPDEMRRTGVAILATALSVADARPTDLERYLDCLRLEDELRASACAKVDDQEVGHLWTDWCRGARMWLRALCLGLSPEGSAAASRARDGAQDAGAPAQPR